MKHRLSARYALLSLIVGGLMLSAFSCDSESPETAAVGKESHKTSTGEAHAGVKTDSQSAPGANDSAALLELAFEAARSIPLNPHVKGQAQAMEAVFVTALELDETALALRYAQQIPNWRRGAALADLAAHLTEMGTKERVSDLLAQASVIADEELKEEAPQAWRRDRVRMKIARVHALLGNEAQAAHFEAGVERSEAGGVAAIRVRSLPTDRIDVEIERIDETVRTGEFDQIRTALQTCIAIHDRCYDDVARRQAMAQRVRHAYAKLPIMVRVELVMGLIDSALKHEDRSGALLLIEDIHERYLKKYKWLPADEFRIKAQLATRFHRAGDPKRALREAQAIETLYEMRRKEIVNIDRAGTLRPLAEAYHALGNREAALKIYRSVIEEGVVNPNSRPRAEDLVATLCSLARHDVRPTPALMSRLQVIHAGLGTPW